MTAELPRTAVPDERDVLRLPPPPIDFVPDLYAPSLHDFAPSTLEKEARPVSISVWDASLTTPAQARALRGRECIVLVGQVRAAKHVGAACIADEPVEPEFLQSPGAAGHAGMELQWDLSGTKAQKKAAQKELLTRIASVFRLHAGE